MKLQLPPDGAPGEHQGISHTIKHYLRPSEAWEDVCENVAPAHRPAAVCDRLAPLSSAPWRLFGASSVALAEVWPELHETYRQGYGQILTALAQPLEEPRRGGVWVVHEGKFACHPGCGVILKIERPVENGMNTAYRAVDFPFNAHECPRRDERYVVERRKEAERQAARRMTAWRSMEGEP
jgi:hypothetical protein